MSPSITLRDGLGVSGRAVLRVWDVDELVAERPSWRFMNRGLREAFLMHRELWPCEPRRVIRSENLILDNYYQLLASGTHPDLSNLALGDGTTAPAAGNDSLNNEVYRTIVGQREQDGADRLTSTLISQNEANGQDIREVGLTTGSETEPSQLVTHIVLDSADRIEPKTSDMTVTIDYIIEYR